MEWLHNTGCPWDVLTARAASSGGHLEVVKWLHNHGCARSWLTPAYAARFGHLAVLQWAREHGCPWNWNVCSHAASAGQLEVLQWARENDATGQAWNENTARNHAAGPRKQEVLTWLDHVSGP